MKNFRIIILTLMVLALVVPAFGQKGSTQKGALPTATERGIAPDTYAGNFVSSDDDQVCYDMSALGYIGEVTEEMRGFKIDPPVDYSDGYVSTTISADGRFLDWESQNAVVLAFIIKGGPNYNVFNYVGTGFDWDKGLFSPAQKGKIPGISHYNVCYTPEDDGGEQGCTPGYWRNHADRWFGVAPGDDFDTTFGVDLFTPDITLGMAVNSPQTYGVFAFHAVAALLNAYGGVANADGTTVAYPYSVDQVLAMVQGAAAVEDDPDTVEDESKTALDAAKDLLAAANELGCPLGGTKAVPVP
jgi:hypothetical protein